MQTGIWLSLFVTLSAAACTASDRRDLEKTRRDVHAEVKDAVHDAKQAVQRIDDKLPPPRELRSDVEKVGTEIKNGVVRAGERIKQTAEETRARVREDVGKSP